jgi:hypothetical protein
MPKSSRNTNTYSTHHNLSFSTQWRSSWAQKKERKNPWMKDWRIWRGISGGSEAPWWSLTELLDLTAVPVMSAVSHNSLSLFTPTTHPPQSYHNRALCTWPQRSVEYCSLQQLENDKKQTANLTAHKFWMHASKVRESNKTCMDL